MLDYLPIAPQPSWWQSQEQTPDFLILVKSGPDLDMGFCF